MGGWDVFVISYNHDHGFSPHKGLLNGLKLHGYALTVLNDMSLMSVQHFSSGLCFFSITILGLYHSCQKVCITAVKNVCLQGLEINTIVIIIFVMDIDDQLYSVLKTNMIVFD